MKNSLLTRSTLLASVALAAASPALAQDASKAREKQASAVHKAQKVWTDDDLGAVHQSAVVSVAQAPTPSATQTAQTGTAAAPAASTGKQDSNAGPKGPAALSHPKTLEDADKMIAWEQRDIDSQQEFVDRLQTELEQAPPDQKERLQKALAERQQYLADTRQEQQALIAEKKLLQKRSSGETSAASSQSPR
jgi:hypothetical protein